MNNKKKIISRDILFYWVMSYLKFFHLSFYKTNVSSIGWLLRMTQMGRGKININNNKKFLTFWKKLNEY